MIQVQGIKEINDVLNAWPLELQHKALQAVHAEAAIPLVNMAHLLAPVGKGENATGNLAASIGVEKPSVQRAGEVGQVIVGPRRKNGYKGFAAHLVEYGTKQRTRKNGGSTGVMPKHPFMKPAFDSTNTQLFNKVDEILSRKMVSVMKRKIKSNGGTWSKL